MLRKEGAKGGGPTYREALEEALCFGWIDGKLISRDGDSFLLRFSPRKPKSVWSLRNKRIVLRLMKAGLMDEAGLRTVREAKSAGEWQRAYASEALPRIPRDLMDALRAHASALAGFRRLPASARLSYIRWVLDAVKPETRRGRIRRVVANSVSGLKPGESKAAD